MVAACGYHRFQPSGADLDVSASLSLA